MAAVSSSFPAKCSKTAKAARSKPSIPLLFKSFNITTNPVVETEPDESQNRTDRHPMSLAELRKYWSLIKSRPGFRTLLSDRIPGLTPPEHYVDLDF